MRTGLRTEIILSISLLLAAALLFAGFLLVKLTERNLLEQQRVHAGAIVRLVVAGLDEAAPASAAGNELDLAVASLPRLQKLFDQQPDVIAWRLVDSRSQVLASTAYAAGHEFSAISPSALEKGQVYEDLVYESWRFLHNADIRNYLELSTPLWAGNEPYGLLQVSFNLEDLHHRVQGAQKLTLLYVIVYGVVLAMFGVYLLNRNVVNPVRQLHKATTAVAGGALTSVNIPSGPGEIHELANSFNQMVAALAASRAETEEHIASLEETNQALAQARDDLVRSEKLATVGHLAAGMAHEIGNPLGAVVGYLNILKEDLTDGNRDLVERSLVEAGRIDRLVRELLQYAAPGDRQKDCFCPVSLLRETVDMLYHQGQFDGIEVADNCSMDDHTVSMDRGRLMQVWINLLLNARDAMQSSGRIEISSTHNDQSITVSIRDDGGGIEPETAKRIFEPFFTTKAPGRGYGLGLAVCQRIIDESGGRVAVATELGQGSCFTVTLPKSPEKK